MDVHKRLRYVVVTNSLDNPIVATIDFGLFCNGTMLLQLRPGSLLVSEAYISGSVTVLCFRQRSPSEKPLK